MENLSPEELEAKLTEFGFENLTKSIMMEFSEFLKKDKQSQAQVNQNAPVDNPPYPKHQKNVSKNVPSKKAIKNAKKTNTNTKRAVPKEYEMKESNSSASANEETFWYEKFDQLSKKAEKLDVELAAAIELCRLNTKKTSRSLYPLKYVSYTDPYPDYAHVRPGSGYIHPYPIKSSRNRNPIYKEEICYPPPHFVKQLRASETRPRPYIPGNEQRNDDLRFRIREKLYYSHPNFRNSSH